MAQNIWMQPAQPPRRGRSWLRTLLIGLCLFIVTTIVMFFTSNPNLYPTVILIGNFLVPVVFVAFLYDHQHFSTLTPATVATSFCVGGVLGVIGTSVLESLLLPIPSHMGQDLPLTSALAVGLIEEGCKLAIVMFLARKMSHTLAIDGLLLGGAVGMGFAALESTGYAFTTFLLSHGLVGASLVETVIRGLLAPFGHGVWTAILGAVLFRQSGPRHFRITGWVLLAYLFVSLLHGLWDGLPNTIFLIIPPGFDLPVITLTLGVIGIITLVVLYRRAMTQHRQLTSPLPTILPGEKSLT
ncbi:MAG TPA: PrsW family glutamic-type intramembrane protease [Ktedonosporobacter sp.]|nr:PrsW family glutamic-type intramembrane protease [Ktedonosporobacter sp.]